MQFHCPHHPNKTEEVIGKVSIRIVGDEAVAKTSHNKEIRCPLKKCNAPMVQEEPKGDYSTVNVGKYTSMSKEGKREHLKKRAKDFNKKKINKDAHRYAATSHLEKHG